MVRLLSLRKYNEIFTEEDGNPLKYIFDATPSINEKNYPSVFIDTLYVMFLYQYGDRYVAPIVERILSRTNNIENAIVLMGGSFATIYSNTLDRLHKALTIEYDPIENYSATETYTDTRQLSDKTVDSLNKTTTDSSTTDTDTDAENTVNTELKKSGYNVAEPITDTIQNTTENNTSSNTETVERSGNETHAGQSDKTVAETITHTLKRSGNIGVTTSQQMIESELTLRNNDFWDILLKKFADTFTLSIY